MKNILHVIDTTGPGGAETVFLDLVTGLPKDKYNSIVHIRGKGWVYEQLCSFGIEPIILDAKGSFNWRYLLQLIKLIKSNHIDVIQSHLLGSNIYCSLAGILTGIPVVATFHGAVDVGVDERFKSLKFGIINKGAKKIIAVSDHLRLDMIATTSINEKKLEVIYNGIATSKFQYSHSNRIRESFQWNKECILIGSLGNVRTAKGYKILLYAASKLKSKALPFRFVIAGEVGGDLYDELLKLRKELNIEDYVHFLGFNDNPAEFLSNIDIFLLTSLTEGFSISTIQAMASGLPVLATKSGGPEEIITHRVNGLLVEKGDPDAIAEALEEMVADKKLCDQLSSNAKLHAISSFDIQKMINAYIRCY